MIYAVYVHHDGDEAYSVTIPDFPGCYPTAERWNDIPGAIQECLEVHMERIGEVVPEPTPLDRLKDDSGYLDGTWLLVDIDTTRFDQRHCA